MPVPKRYRHRGDIEGECTLTLRNLVIVLGQIRAIVIGPCGNGGVEEIVPELAVGAGRPVRRSLDLRRGNGSQADGQVVVGLILDGTGRIQGMNIDTRILDYERFLDRKMISIEHGFRISSRYVFSYLGNLYRDNPERLFNDIDDFGFNADLCPELHTASPQIASPETPDYLPANLLMAAYGYGIYVTPFHMIAFYNAIANHGKLVSPLLVYDYEKNGKTVNSFSRKTTHEICTEDVAESVIDALHDNIVSGTAFRLIKHDIAGKTSINWLVSNDPNHDDSGHFSPLGSFTGFFPTEKPKYTFFVYLYSNPSDLAAVSVISLSEIVAGKLVTAFYEWNPSLKGDAKWNMP